MVLGAVGPGIIFIIIGIFVAVYAYFVWGRIRFAGMCLEIGVTVFKKFYSPLFVNVGLVGVSLFFIFTDVAAYIGLRKVMGDGANSIYWILVFIYLWHQFTWQNTSHTTSCGVMATWFFTQETQDATWNAFKNAMTTSFGSIAFGSAVEAVVRTVQAMLNAAKNDARRSGNLTALVCAAIIECLISLLGDILEYVNSYAFVQVAVYGKEYWESCKATFQLFKSKGFDAIINDDLTGLPFIVGGIMGLILFIGVPIIIDSKSIISIIIVAVFGIFLYFGTVQVVRSYIKTLFVCWCMDPQGLYENRPQTFNALVAAANDCDYDVQWSQINGGV